MKVIDPWKKIIFILCFSLVFLHASGQGKVSYNYDQRRFNPYLSRFSYTFSLGFSAYSGELSGFLDPDQQHYYLNPGLGFGLAYRINDHFSVRGELNGFSLYSESIKYAEKNISFTGINLDYYLNAVIDLFPKGKIDGKFYQWDAHIFGGVGHVVFFPNSTETTDTGTGIILTDSSTSYYDYAKLSTIFPVGAGVKYYIDKNHYLSVEGNYRFTLTDFLDAVKDLSHESYDKYFTLFLKYTVIIDTTPRKSFDYDRYIMKRKKNIRE
ncbi:MAG: hypothetical protein KFF73_00555 [Cyclobacteriaceae bacterium]|nr:hypothetical protein [Cyclobacteriaceae bacterium]